MALVFSSSGGGGSLNDEWRNLVRTNAPWSQALFIASIISFLLLLLFFFFFSGVHYDIMAVFNVENRINVNPAVDTLANIRNLDIKYSCIDMKTAYM